jgi:hypothetical protein
MHFFAQTAFRPDAETISHKQHADQQFRVDRWTACVAVKLGQILADVIQINKPINRA